MDAKDLRTESALSERNNDGSKYSQSGGIALHCDRNKPYQDIGSNSLGKVDVPSVRPCAVIGPDRVVPPPASNDAYLKKAPAEPWPCLDNPYLTRRPPEYPHKLANYQNPTRNISPRQTFQENMQRIMVPPSYNSVKISDDINYPQMSERSNALPKNIKLNLPSEAKFCDVPYTVFSSNNEQKNVRNPEMCSVNSNLTRTAPPGWPPASVNVRPSRTYGAPEMYQYQDFPSCAGPRPVVPRPNRTVPEEANYVYADHFYHPEGNIRFKPYPSVKERFPQQRYEYIGNYVNSFHPPPPFPSHKYELQKPGPSHPYPPYPPIKYMDRMPDPTIEGYQRNQSGPYNIPYRSQIIHPNYGAVLGNCPQNKIHSYPSDAHVKSVAPNKLPYDNPKAHIEYDNGRPKIYPQSESFLVNEMGRMHAVKSQVIMPNYPNVNMHNMTPNPYYKKDQQMKNYEYLQAHYRSIDPNINMQHPMVRHQPVFSPNTIAISPTDSSNSNDNSQNLGTTLEDCGYVSQSSSASVRSMDSGFNRIPNDHLRKYYDSRFGPMVRTVPMMTKSELSSNNNSKEKKNIDVRQFLSMWNEGDEETEENNSKEIISHSGPKGENNFSKPHEIISQPNQEQLYVLGLVNVPSEELAKYEHIQKVSKLPENIKGYNHIELLTQFEQAIECSNMVNFKTSKDYLPSKVVTAKQSNSMVPPRPLSPLDVEAKISQSVIHKEVGCNFEIKPCSPKMLNVEVATPVQNILAERAIEKVTNPVMLKSSSLNGIDDNIDCDIFKRQDHVMNQSIRNPSCKMTPFSNNSNLDSSKNSYSLHDLESNSGLCLASLPRLDNDIELNFPEVNQQFINANKADSSVSNSLRDLPSLETLDQSDNQTTNRLDVNIMPTETETIKSPCLDSEKEFSKLSKYRKSKPQPSDSKDNLNAVRTDSVIIKNPENTKNHEEKPYFTSNCLSPQINFIQQAPINLTSQGNNSVFENNSINISKSHSDTSIEIDTTIELAIDFSLNKNNSNDKNKSVVKNEKETGITQNVKTNLPLLDDNLTKLESFRDCDQNIQHTFSYDNKLGDVKSSKVIYGTEKTEDVIKKMNTDSLHHIEDMFTQNQCVSPTSILNKDDDEIDRTSSVPCANEANTSSNSLLPMEFVTSTPELSTVNNDNSRYLMDIDKNDTIEDTCLEKTNNFIESDVDNDDLKNQDCCMDETDLKDLIDDNGTNIEVVDNEGSPKVDNIRDLQKIDSSVVTTESQCSNFLSNTRSKSDFNLPSLNDIEDDVVAVNSKADDELDADFELSPTSDILTHSQDSNGSDATDRKIAASPNNGTIDIIEHEINCDLSSFKTPLDNLNAADINMHEKKVNTPAESSIEDQVGDNTLLLRAEKNAKILNNFEITKISKIVENKCLMHRKYLSYGSKEMYSPWIQKLILYCEGNIRSNVSTLNVRESAHSDIPFEFDNSVVNGDTSRIVRSDNSIEETYENNMKEEIKSSLTNYDTKINAENIYENCSTPVKDNNFMNTDQSSISDDKLPQNDEVNLTVDSHFNEKYTKNDVNKVSEMTSVAADTDDMVNYCDKLDAKHVSEEVIVPLSPKVLERWSCKSDYTDEISERCFSKSNCTDDETKHCKDSNCNDEIISHDVAHPLNKHEIPEQLNRQHNFNDEFDDQLDKKSRDIDEVSVRLENNMQSDCDNNVTDPVDSQSYSKDKMTHEMDIQSDNEITDQVDSPFCGNDIESDQLETRSDCHTKITTDPVCSQVSGNDEVPVQSEIHSEPNVELTDEVDSQCFVNDKETDHLDKQSYYCDGTSNQADMSYSCDETVSWTAPSDILPNCNDETPEQPGGQFNDELINQLDIQPNCNNNKVSIQCSRESICDNEVNKEENIVSNCKNVSSNQCEQQSYCNYEMTDEKTYSLDVNFSSNNIEPKSCTVEADEVTKIQTNNLVKRRCQLLKRSLSDSALNVSNNNDRSQKETEENVPFIWPFKRKKNSNDTLAQKLCNIIQSNRRNSVSSFYNEENVSFCILIDNSCIIAEEENDDQEKICFTELAEDSLPEAQNACIETQNESIKVDELSNVIEEEFTTPQQKNDYEYSDSYVMHGEDEKVEDSWVEDVACVETVICDDVAEDIEISGPSSPGDDIASDNDESGVFSCSDHTDKVKYIYGDKMCTDDAQFVDTLYNTPQMDVTKTLVQRETLLSGDYYDNDSLEKMLSEPNHIIPYVPGYVAGAPLYESGMITETIDNKENMETTQSKPNALDVVNMGIDNLNRDIVRLGQLFDETQDDTVHSCESSVDNVFTYSDNEEKSNYSTSSSPEVSSTTSEEKNSAILLKITNYKGSRISQISNTGRDNKRSCCKFTEKKDYVQSHSNFPTNRPLLTKAAQKYIPPLKESIRDLKVKLTLPQHSLIKLKELKKSKDVPKTCKPNTAPNVSKKPKPKFEDVLKSIDEIQFKMHKEKTKKSKKFIPKVVIKKNENGSHYASTSHKNEFNPDLTGRKWQPWVFIEKSHFIDKMAVKNKTKAVYSHRKKTYVLAEKFQKYKSVSSAKFVIAPPISDCPSTGLKYTIRLKHNY